MCSSVVNTMCNNTLFSWPTIDTMDRTDLIHETTRRLYLAATAFKGDDAPAKVAARMNISPQTLQNWEPRGVSKDGALKAQAVYGCDANWILGGGAVGPVWGSYVARSPICLDRTIVEDVARTLLETYEREHLVYDFTEEWELFADMYDDAAQGSLQSTNGKVTIGKWMGRKALQGAGGDKGRKTVPAPGTHKGKEGVQGKR